jgi:hypothetical protein
MVKPRIPEPDFVIEFNPAAMTVLQGQSGQSSGKVTSIDGFAGQVMLACSGLPPGVQWAFQPNPVMAPPNASGGTTLTVTADSSVQPGTYPFNMTSTNTDVVRRFPMQLTVLGRPQEPAFAVACEPSSVGAPPGGLAQTTCTVTSMGGFSQLVTWSLTDLPEGVAGAFQPAAVTPPPNGQAGSVLILRLAPSETRNLSRRRARHGCGWSVAHRQHRSEGAVTSPAVEVPMLDGLDTWLDHIAAASGRISPRDRLQWGMKSARIEMSRDRI